MTETIVNQKNWFDSNIFYQLDSHPVTTNYTWFSCNDDVRYIYHVQWYGSAYFGG